MINENPLLGDGEKGSSENSLSEKTSNELLVLNGDSNQYIHILETVGNLNTNIQIY